MFGYIKRSLAKRKLKRTFRDYGYQVESFDLPGLGKVEFAQWKHPLIGRVIPTRSQVDFYRNWLSPGDLAIDIGAHTGDTTVPMALAAGNEGLVIALEPNRYVYKVLEKNASLNSDLTRIVPLAFAATMEDGEFVFHYSDASFGNGGFLSEIEKERHGHPYELRVKGVNLDRYLRKHYPDQLPRLRLLKVDAEGYDKEILKNLSGIIREFRPALMVECYKRLNREEREELYTVTTGLGYDLYYLENFEVDGQRELLSMENMHQRKHFEMLALPKDH